MGRRLHPPQEHPTRERFMGAFSRARDHLITTGVMRRDITQLLARRLGVTRRTVYRWRDGVTSAPPDAMETLERMGTEA